MHQILQLNISTLEWPSLKWCHICRPLFKHKKLDTIFYNKIISDENFSDNGILIYSSCVFVNEV